MTRTTKGAVSPLVLVGAERGVTLIPAPTDLTRLNYFDGKFLRAADMTREQEYLRNLVRHSNRGGGAGVVCGLDAVLTSGTTLEVSPGLAVDPAGRVLLLPDRAVLELPRLLDPGAAGAASPAAADPSPALPGFGECAKGAAAPAAGAFGMELYTLAAAHAEALCGEEDAYGKLCEEACASGGNHPYRLEGVVLLALPLSLPPAPCRVRGLEGKHGRSLAASAYFARERDEAGEMSAARLRSREWCAGAAAETGSAVPLAVLAVSGGTARWIDPWMARRERMEAPPRRFWAGQLRLRPWPVFLAQVLQFQCHLADVLPASGASGEDGAAGCDGAQARLLRRAERLLAAAGEGDEAGAEGPPGAGAAYRLQAARLRGDIQAALAACDAPRPLQVLIDAGIVELPPAGYLPVAPDEDVEAQARALLGPGVELRVCAADDDEIAQALEEARSSDRICLLRGLSDPRARASVDVLVPDGVETAPEPEALTFFEAELALFRSGRPVPEPVRFEVAAGQPWFDRGEPIGFRGQAYVKQSILVIPRGDLQFDEVGAYRGVPVYAQRGESPPYADIFVLANVDGALQVYQVDPSVSLPDGNGQDETGDDGETSPLLLLRGAARGEVLDSGGGAFHFAGFAAAPDLEEEADDHAGDGEEFDLESLSYGAAGSRAGGSAARAPGLGEALGALFGAARGRGRGLDLELPAGPLALWVSLRCDADPFTLGVRQSASVRAELVLGGGGDERPVAAELELRGTLMALRSAAGGALKAWLSVRAFLSDTRRAGGPAEHALEAEVELRREAAPGSGRLRARVPSGGVELAFETRWNGAGATVVQAVAAGLPGEEQPELVRGTLRENAEVALAADSWHADAVRALRRIDVALPGVGFRARAEGLLFPPEPAAAAPAVRATRDWVLFRRRRRGVCGRAPAAARPRTYAVYHTREVSPVNTVEEMRETISGAVPIDPETVRFIRQVPVFPVFRGGSGELVTSGEEILTRWLAMDRADALVYAAISAGGEGEAVARTRLTRLVSALGNAPPTGGAALEVLPGIAPEFDPVETDGVIVLVTRAAAPRTVLHGVLLVETPSRLQGLMRALSEGSAGARLQEFAIPLGEVEFTAGTDRAVGDTLEQVAAAWTPSASRIATFTRVLVTPGEPDPWHGPQSARIARRLGASVRSEDEARCPIEGNEEAYGGAEVITVLAARTA